MCPSTASTCATSRTRRSRTGQQRRDTATPTAAILFYRAHALSGNTAFVDELVDALEHARPERAARVHVEPAGARTNGMPAALRIVGDRADVVISTLSFALGERRRARRRRRSSALAFRSCRRSRAACRARRGRCRSRGLTALDTAINVAIPEFDGRIITVPLSFKDRSEDAPGLYAPHAGARRARRRHSPRTARASASAASRGRCASPSS